MEPARRTHTARMPYLPLIPGVFPGCPVRVFDPLFLCFVIPLEIFLRGLLFIMRQTAIRRRGGCGAVLFHHGRRNHGRNRNRGRDRLRFGYGRTDGLSFRDRWCGGVRFDDRSLSEAGGRRKGGD